MNIGNRLRIYLGYKGVTRKLFSDSIDVKYNSLCRILNSNSAMNSETLEKIFIFFPELNTRWLITGKGPMEYSVNAYHLADDEKEVIPVENTKVDKEELIPIYIGRSELEKIVSELVQKEINKL